MSNAFEPKPDSSLMKEMQRMSNLIQSTTNDSYNNERYTEGQFKYPSDNTYNDYQRQNSNYYPESNLAHRPENSNMYTTAYQFGGYVPSSMPRAPPSYPSQNNYSPRGFDQQ